MLHVGEKKKQQNNKRERGRENAIHQMLISCFNGMTERKKEKIREKKRDRYVEIRVKE